MGLRLLESAPVGDRPVGGAMRRIDLVIFDCDGVLIDSEAISARMLVAEMAARGIEIDLEYVARHFLGRSYPVVLKVIAQDFGVDLPESFEADYRRRLLAAFETQLQVMPGVTGALDRLARPYCLATSSSPSRLARSLEIAGLSGRFAGRVSTASEVARGKPAPDLFLLAARKAGADPAHCLVIEDSLNGVRAALAAGMEAWRFTGGSHFRDIALPDPGEVRAHRDFDRFEAFFETRPDLAGSAA